jgi:hypothetical protein
MKESHEIEENKKVLISGFLGAWNRVALSGARKSSQMRQRLKFHVIFSETF